MIDIPTMTKETRIDNIVLRINWAEHTTRILRIAGVEGEGPPVWRNRDPLSGLNDTLLAQCAVTPGGSIIVKNTGTIGCGDWQSSMPL